MEYPAELQGRKPEGNRDSVVVGDKKLKGEDG